MAGAALVRCSPLLDTDLYWLAGLLEGEGCFTYSHGRYPSIQLSMTDLDIVERAADLLGVTVGKARGKKFSHHKQQWRCHLYGLRAAEMMRLLRPLMGERRGERIGGILADWDSWEHKMPKGSGLRTPAKCHPEKPVFGGGLCGTCYMRLYRQGWRVRSAA